MPGYRVEYASSGRSKCNGRKPCKGTAIEKGQIRFGTWVTVQEHGAFKWRHWGCLTSSVLKNVTDELDNQMDDLDGLEELKPEDQKKIKKAFEEGLIDPADVPPTAIAEKSEDPKTEAAEPTEESKTDDANPKKRKRAPANKKSKPSVDQDENLGPEDPPEEKPLTKKKKATEKKQPVKEKKQTVKEKKETVKKKKQTVEEKKEPVKEKKQSVKEKKQTVREKKETDKEKNPKNKEEENGNEGKRKKRTSKKD